MRPPAVIKWVAVASSVKQVAWMVLRVDAWTNWVAYSSLASEVQPRRRNAPKLSGGHCNHTCIMTRGTQGWREDAVYRQL